MSKDNFSRRDFLKSLIGSLSIGGFFASCSKSLKENQPPQKIILYEPIDITNTSVTLKWSQSADDDFASYEIYYSTNSDVLSDSTLVVSIAQKEIVTYTVTGLNQDTLYYFIVVVKDTGELMTGSNIVSAKTTKQQGTLTAVTLYSITTYTKSSITLNWSKNNDSTFAKYVIYMSKTAGVTDASTKVKEIMDQNTITYTVTGLMENTDYYFKVYVYNNTGDKVGSNEVKGRTAKEQTGKTKLVVVYHSGAMNGGTPNRSIIKQMLEAGISEFGGMSAIFPSINQNDTVCIKVNCLFPTHTNPILVEEVAKLLVSAGFKENNIIIWDRNDSDLEDKGYTINKSSNGVRCFGTNWDFDSIEYTVAGSNQRLSNILVKSTYLINMPVLKDHSGAGVTLSMKNHYGSCSDVGSLHDNYCDPGIAELNALFPIKNKTKLIILDALWGVYQGGPGGDYQITPKKIVISKDPVALDTYGLNMINSEREAKGIWQIDINGEAKHIKTAESLGLGTTNLSNVDVIEKNIG